MIDYAHITTLPSLARIRKDPRQWDFFCWLLNQADEDGYAEVSVNEFAKLKHVPRTSVVYWLNSSTFRQLVEATKMGCRTLVFFCDYASYQKTAVKKPSTFRQLSVNFPSTLQAVDGNLKEKEKGKQQQQQQSAGAISFVGSQNSATLDGLQQAAAAPAAVPAAVVASPATVAAVPADAVAAIPADAATAAATVAATPNAAVTHVDAATAPAAPNAAVTPTDAANAPAAVAVAATAAEPLSPLSEEELEKKRKAFWRRCKRLLEKDPLKREAIIDFFYYWTQVAADGRHLGFELEPKFGIEYRLKWYIEKGKYYQTVKQMKLEAIAAKKNTGSGAGYGSGGRNHAPTTAEIKRV